MERTFRLYDFNVYNEKCDEHTSSDEEGVGQNKDLNKFMIQMFGKNEKGKSCSIIAEGFKPFFYVKVDDSWSAATKNAFVTRTTSRKST